MDALRIGSTDGRIFAARNIGNTSPNCAAGYIRKSNLTDLKDVPTYELEEIKHFFEVYKTLEPGKEVHGGEWVGHDAAELEINASYKRYTDSH